MGVIKIYADGACRGNQFKENIGGYGIIMIYGNYKKEFKNAFKNVTNNQMELLSVITALKMLKQYDIPIEVYSDSQYVVNTINLNWKKNANKDLWEELYNILDKIKDIYNKGNKNIKGNFLPCIQKQICVKNNNVIEKIEAVNLKNKEIKDYFDIIKMNREVYKNEKQYRIIKRVSTENKRNT